MDHTPFFLPFLSSFSFSSLPFILALALDQQQDAIFLFCFFFLNTPCCSLNTYCLLQHCIRNCPNSAFTSQRRRHVRLLGFLMAQGWRPRCSPRALKISGCETQKRVLSARGEHLNISRYPEHPSSYTDGAHSLKRKAARLGDAPELLTLTRSASLSQ